MSVSIFVVSLVFKGCFASIYVRGPKYVEIGNRINITCSSDESPRGLIADFVINTKSHTSLQKTNDSCLNTKLRLKCSIECACSEDGKTYFLQLAGLLRKGVNVIACLMRFGAEEMLDTLNVYVVDVHGPKITVDQDLPFEAGMDIELTCSLETDLEEFEFTLKCLNLSAFLEKQKDSSLYIARIQIKADRNNSGEICSCSFIKDSIIKTDTILIEVIYYPSIKVVENITCNNNATIKITCVGLGELTGFGFSDWTHILNGTVIRKLRGHLNQTMSVLTLPQCTYRDAGDYLCSAFNTFQDRKFWSNKRTSIGYQGSPIVISANTYTTSGTTFSVQYISKLNPKKEQWFIFDELINDSPGFILSSAKGPIYFEIYGNSISAEGYLANLTITSNDSGVYTVLLQNDLGITKHQFILKPAGSKFNMNSLTLLIALCAVFIITTTVTVVTMSCRNRQYFFSRTEHGIQGVSIYYAAPSQEAAESSNAYDSTTTVYERTIEYEHRRQYDVTVHNPEENDERKDSTEEDDSSHDYIEIE